MREPVDFGVADLAPDPAGGWTLLVDGVDVTMGGLVNGFRRAAESHRNQP